MPKIFNLVLTFEDGEQQFKTTVSNNLESAKDSMIRRNDAKLNQENLKDSYKKIVSIEELENEFK